MKCSLLNIFLLLLSASLLAQEEKAEPTGKFLNAGVSAGLGGNRLFFGSPLVKVKVGPLYAKGIVLPLKNETGSFEMGLDLFSIPTKRRDVVRTINFNVGITEFDRLLASDQWYSNLSFLAGLTTYPINKRIEYGFRVGVIDVWTGYYHSYGRYGSIIPYGEVSFDLNLFRNGSKQCSVAGLAQFKSGLPERVFTKKRRKVINPYLSVGVGQDRGGILPLLGVRYRDFYLEGIVLPSVIQDKQWQVGGGVNLKNLNIYGATVGQSVTASFYKSRDYDYKNGRYDGFSGTYMFESREQTVLIPGLWYGWNVIAPSGHIMLKVNAGARYVMQKDDVRSRITIENIVTNNRQLRPGVGISLVMYSFGVR